MLQLFFSDFSGVGALVLSWKFVEKAIPDHLTQQSTSGTFCTLEIINRGSSQACTPSILETELNASTWQATGW